MGAWIEINLFHVFASPIFCRTPRWVRGLKSKELIRFLKLLGRTPRWVRGLKFDGLKRHTTVP